MQTPMITYGIMKSVLYAVCAGIVLFAFSAHAADFEITDSMTKREYRYGETPTFTLSFRSGNGTFDTANIEVRFVREDGVSLATTTDIVNISTYETVVRSYPLVITEWRAGYYYVIAKVVYSDNSATIVRRVTFSLRPHIVSWWVYGGSGFAVVIGLSVIMYALITERRARHTLKTPVSQTNGGA